ncbi:MAG: protein translocase subunit SecF [Patescibacteria group bacterium]
MIYKIIQRRKIFLSISILAVVASIAALIAWGLNFGVDFRGGSLLEVEFTGYQPTIAEIQDNLGAAGLHNLVIQPTEDSFILRFKEDTEEAHQAALSGIETLISGKEEASFRELRLDAVGPAIGQELKSKSFNAGFIVLIMIIIYISAVFRKVSKPVASWKYGVTAIIALTHDVLITLGVFSLLGHFYGTEINTPFIAAILTVLGYSVNDTIIVFDRIRENLPNSREDFENTVNRSVNQTLSRSINTSASSILVLLAIIFLGGATIKDFALALAIGIFIGTYSSIFVASPVLVIWDNLVRRARKS